MQTRLVTIQSSHLPACCCGYGQGRIFFPKFKLTTLSYFQHFLLKKACFYSAFCWEEKGAPVPGTAGVIYTHEFVLRGEWGPRIIHPWISAERRLRPGTASGLRCDGLGEKLRDCAHFSLHTIFYIQLERNKEFLKQDTGFNYLLCYESMLLATTNALLHPVIIGELLLKWHLVIGIIIQLHTILRWSSDGQASRTGAKMVNDVGVVWQRLYDCCEWVMTWWHHIPYISMFISYCHKSDQSILSCVQECWMLIISRQEPGQEMVCLPSLTIYEAIWRQFFQKWSHLYLQLRLL